MKTLILIFLSCTLVIVPDPVFSSGLNLGVTKKTATAKKESTHPWASKEDSTPKTKEKNPLPKRKEHQPLFTVTFGEKIDCRVLPK